MDDHSCAIPNENEKNLHFFRGPELLEVYGVTDAHLIPAAFRVPRTSVNIARTAFCILLRVLNSARPAWTAFCANCMLHGLHSCEYLDHSVDQENSGLLCILVVLHCWHISENMYYEQIQQITCVISQEDGRKVRQ